jgi:hypothetical protein
MFVTGDAASAVVVSDAPAANEGRREAMRG